MEKKTTIQIFVKTRDRLRSLGERNEDYDNIITRILDGDIVTKKKKELVST
jgi:hypothetical protein